MYDNGLIICDSIWYKLTPIMIAIPTYNKFMLILREMDIFLKIYLLT